MSNAFSARGGDVMGMPGYHIAPIERGVYGHPSKIVEEINEFVDALEQNCPVMALVELSDLIGAVRGYLAENHPSITLDDLVKMSLITERAFVSGHRRSR